MQETKLVETNLITVVDSNFSKKVDEIKSLIQGLFEANKNNLYISFNFENKGLFDFFEDELKKDDRSSGQKSNRSSNRKAVRSLDIHFSHIEEKGETVSTEIITPNKL